MPTRWAIALSETPAKPRRAKRRVAVSTIDDRLSTCANLPIGRQKATTKSTVAIIYWIFKVFVVNRSVCIPRGHRAWRDAMRR